MSHIQQQIEMQQTSVSYVEQVFAHYVFGKSILNLVVLPPKIRI